MTSVLRHPGKAAGRDMRAFPDLRVVDLVGDEPEVARPHHFGDLAERRLRVDRARGIVGRVEEEGYRALGLRVDGVRARLEAVLRPCRDRDGHEPRAADRSGIGGVVWIDEERPVPGFAHEMMCREEGGLPAGRDQHVLWRRRHSRPRRDPRRHRPTEFIGPAECRIPRVPAPGRGVHRREDRRIGADIVLPDGEVRDLHALRLQGARAEVETPAAGAVPCEVRDAMGDLHAPERGMAHPSCQIGKCARNVEVPRERAP